MTTYSKTDFDLGHYNTARPTYPDSFYEALMLYHDGPTQLAVDVGCGSGFVAFKLKAHFDRVIGTDVSATMITQCKADPRATGNIEFFVAPAESSPPEISEKSVDLITAAECCHWMDHPRFFAECSRILKPGGTLAFWFYQDPVFVDSPRATEINLSYSYGSKVDGYERYFGPYYEQPGHDLFKTGMANVEIPSDYVGVIRREYHPTRDELTPLHMTRRITLKVYRDYVTSWSGYHTWKRAHPDKPDTADEFMKELADALGVDMETPVDIVFPTVYTFAKTRAC